MTNSNIPLTVSIIVPIYNREKYIARCVDSILKQTYTDFELILVDDGSKDTSLSICQDYAAKDSRIKVFHQENAGVSAARNLGVDNAKGEWLCFVDSDDYVTEYYIQHLVEIVDKYGEKEALYATGYLFNGEIIRALEDRAYEGKEMMDGIMQNHNPFSKLYNRQIVVDNNINFPMGINNGEDYVFTVNYLLFVEHLFTAAQYDYLYELSETSISDTKNRSSCQQEWKNYRAMREAWEKLLDKYNMTDTERNNSLYGSDALSRFPFVICNQFYSSSSVNEICSQIRGLYEKTPDFKEYIYHKKARGIRTRISRFLLRSRLFLCYVLFNRLIMNLGYEVTV